MSFNGHSHSASPTAPADPLAVPPVIPGASPALVQALAAAWPSLPRERRAAAALERAARRGA